MGKEEFDLGKYLSALKKRPIWQTHTLRWLFYRKVPNFRMSVPSEDKYTSDTRCSKCKWGVNARVVMSFRDDNDVWHSKSSCPHCNKEYVAEPNTNFTHKAYKVGKWIVGLFWAILDRLHLVRSSITGRYEMGGDESQFIASWNIGGDGNFTYKLKSRKWWEYLIIEKTWFDYGK